MNIITIGREFGSGGRELGKRLADALGVPCYDKEIIREVANLQGITPDHVERISRTDVRQIYPTTIGRSMILPVYQNDQTLQVLSSQQEVIQRLAQQGDCVVVGQNADVILKEMKPLNFFVYADMAARLRRCMEHIRPGETERGIRAQIKKIDKSRAANRRLMTDSAWGQPESYHLCVNTTGMEIKAMIPALAAYAKAWFAQQED